MRLRIESADGSLINEYRIMDGRVEVRILDPGAGVYSAQQARWRTMDEKDIELHHALGTVVSKWLKVRLGSDAEESREMEKRAA